MSDDDYVLTAGRVARAGRSGTAYSLVSPDEMPYLLDLHLFLGRDVKWVTDANRSSMYYIMSQNYTKTSYLTLSFFTFS